MSRIPVALILSLAVYAQKPQATRNNSPDLLKQTQETLEARPESEKPVPSCETVSTNAIGMFPNLMEKADYARARALLNEWDRHCGYRRSEKQVRSRLLLTFIEKGEIDFNADDIDAFMEYQDRQSKNYPYGNKTGPTDPDTFDLYTLQLARRALADVSKKKHPVLYFYANEFDKFHAEMRYDGSSEVAKGLQKYHDEIKSMGVLNFGFISGIWYPKGPAGILGAHPFLGLSVGAAMYRYEASFEFHVKFVDSADSRLIEFQGEKILNNTFMTMYWGGNFTFDLIATRYVDIGLTISPGWDHLTVVPNEYDSTTTILGTKRTIRKGGKTLDSFTVGFGPTFRHYLNIDRTDYLYLAARIAPVRYNNSGGQDLTGVGFTFYFGYGIMGSFERANRIRNIGGLD